MEGSVNSVTPVAVVVYYTTLINLNTIFLLEWVYIIRDLTVFLPLLIGCQFTDKISLLLEWLKYKFIT